MRKLLAALMALVLLTPQLASAQATLTQNMPVGTSTTNSICVLQSDSTCAAVSANTALPTAQPDGGACTTSAALIVGTISVQCDSIGYRMAVAQVSGVSSGVVLAEQSNDNFTWTPTQTYSESGTVFLSTTNVTGPAIYRWPAGARWFRIRVTTALVGTPVWVALQRQTNIDSPSSTALATGAATIGGTYSILPVSPATTNGNTTVASAVVTAGQQLKTGVTLLFGLNVTSGASAGYVLVTNTGSVPADGAVTPIRCYALAANTSGEWQYSNPIYANLGISVSFSTTGCFTRSGSATAQIAGEVR